MKNETLEQQTNGPYNNFQMFDNSSSQNQVVEKVFEDKIRRAVDNVVLTVENRMHDAILTGMDTLLIPRTETAVRSITGLTEHGSIRDVQIPDRKDFLRNAGTPLMSAYSRPHLNTNQNRNDETRNKEGFEEGDFSVLTPSFHRSVPLITVWLDQLSKLDESA